MPRPKWTDEQKLEAAQRRAEKKSQAQEPASASAPSSPATLTPTLASTPTLTPTVTYAPFNRILDPRGNVIGTVPIKPLTESLTSTESPEPTHPRLLGLVHINTAISKPRDAQRLKELTWQRYQISKQIKALQAVDSTFEAEGRELLIAYDCADAPLRFDFLTARIGHGGGGSRLVRKKLEAEGTPLDVLARCSVPVKSWERMQVEDATEEKKSRRDGSEGEGEGEERG